MGKIFDLTGSYANAFIMTMTISALAGILAFFVSTEAVHKNTVNGKR